MRKLHPVEARYIAYIVKWSLIAALIGVVAGVGAIILYDAIEFCDKVFLGYIAGYVDPTPAGEGGVSPLLPRNPILIPLVTALGGLLSGVLVYALAPEAEGDGMDAAIDAFHNRGGEIRSRVPIVKLAASAITIGSGGSAGREGPIAQVGAGFGSLLSRILRLKPHERRIAVVVGMGAGIGSIFRAPLGGALLAAEALYTNDFEVEVLPPAFIASVVGYLTFSYVKGWAPMFSCADAASPLDPVSILLYAALGVVSGLAGVAFVKSLHLVEETFRGFPIPKIFKPAIGGLIVGVIGAFFPQVLGTGYGWIQLIVDKRFEFIPASIIPVLVLLKILATSITIGSGGSGGLLAPSLVIGGFLGATTWLIFKAALPSIQTSLASFVIVGMTAFFGGVGKVPVAAIVMASEMTGDYALLAPSMVATSIAYVITGRNTMYRYQLRSKAESPAHRSEYLAQLEASIVEARSKQGRGNIETRR